MALNLLDWHMFLLARWTFVMACHRSGCPSIHNSQKLLFLLVNWVDVIPICARCSPGKGVYRVCSRWCHLSDFIIVSSDTLLQMLFLSNNWQDLAQIHIQCPYSPSQYRVYSRRYCVSQLWLQDFQMLFHGKHFLLKSWVDFIQTYK